MNIQKLVNTHLDYNLTNITNDSRAVKENGIYFAFVGSYADGHDYIDAAIANGAKLIYYTKEDIEKKDSIHYECVENINETFNQVACDFYDNPLNEINLIGVTGTNGKSTTSWIIKYFLDKKYKAGYIGTIGAKFADKMMSVSHTTPLANDYNYMFSEMLKEDVSHVSLEVSSHGLVQQRVSYMNFNCAIMTNLTHEHLDYHKTMDEYLKAKAILFENLDSNAVAILNTDDVSYEYLKNNTKAKVISYGRDETADFYFSNLKLFDDKSEFTLRYKDKSYQISTNLVAEFNIYNLVAVYASLVVNGFTIEELQGYSMNISQVLGRMEKINVDNKLIIVDYAHTPDGFEKVYEYISSLNKAKVISVFSSAGRRDKEKRVVLGRIASKFSDEIILTEEDYRDEDPKQIADEVQAGIDSATVVRYIENREQAIRFGIENLKAEEVLVVLGKGCEEYLYRGLEKDYYKGDKQVVVDAIKGEINE